MKKNFQFLLVLAAMLFCSSQMYSAETRKYGILTVESSAPAKGLVYAVPKTGTPAPENLEKYKESMSVKHSHPDSWNPGQVDYITYVLTARGWSFDKWTSSTNNVKTQENHSGYGDILRLGATSLDENEPTPGTATANFKADTQYTLSLQKPNHGSVTATMTYYSVNTDGTPTLTSAQSSLTINSESLSETTETTIYSADKITLLAEVGNDGSTFVEWHTIDGNGTHTKLGDTNPIDTKLTKNTIFYALITSPEDDATFRIGNANANGIVTWLSGENAFYSDLQSAIEGAEQYSQNTIILLKNYTLPTEQQSYTIPSGITLLIPFRENQNVYTTTPKMSHYQDHFGSEAYGAAGFTDDQAEAFRILTIPANVTLEIDGALSLSGERWFTSDYGDEGVTNSSVSGDNRIRKEYGLINMEKDGKMIINNQGKLYCWGRIRGDGTITAKNGSTIYESLVWTDHRGVDAYGIIMQYSKCFFINQYYVQDIQSEITYEYGSKCLLSLGMFAWASVPVQVAEMSFIDKDNNNGLFVLPNADATISKRYDVKTDRLIWNLTNGASFHAIDMHLSFSGFSGDFSTSKNFMTITNNWTINVNSGTCYIPVDLSLAAGAELNIAEGATVEVKENTSLYVYEGKDWGDDFAAKKRIIPLFLPEYELKNGFYSDVTLTSGKWGSSTYDAIRRPDITQPNAKININGTLKINGGRNAVMYQTQGGRSDVQSGLYTTDNVDGEHGASICSEGQGQIIYISGSGTQTSMPQLYGCGRGKDKNGNPNTNEAGIPSQIKQIQIQPALLYNANGSYTSSANYPANTTFVYENGTWLAKKEIETIKINETKVDINGKSEEIQEATYSVLSGNKIEAKDITIHEGTTLNIEDNASVETQTLALSTTPSAIDTEQGKAGTSSQIKGNGTITAQNVFIDITMDPSGTLDASKYYAFAVPFAVNVDGGVQQLKNAAGEDCIHNTDYRAYTYNGAKRASNGKGSNWTLVDNNGTFQPGVFYLVEFAPGMGNVYRFTKGGGNLNNAANIDLAEFASKNTADKGWNGIANNALQNASISVSNTDVAQIFDPAKNAFVTVDLGNTLFAIGTPLFVQADGAETATNSAAAQPTSAPARMLAQPQIETLGNYTVRIAAENANKMADQLFISASEDAENNYVIGKDLVKMFMGNATTAQLWVNNYDKKLSMHQALLSNGSAEAPLTLYAPKAGDYQVYLKDTPEDATLYLLENGEVIANLNDGAYSVALTKGENTQYGLRINARTIADVITSINEAKATKCPIQKVLFRNKVYIVRDGKLFNTLGQFVK